MKNKEAKILKELKKKLKELFKYYKKMERKNAKAREYHLADYNLRYRMMISEVLDEIWELEERNEK